MNEKRKFKNNSLWWLDFGILNISNLKFKYSYSNNIFFMTILKKYYFFYFLLNKKNINTLLYYNIDCFLLKNKKTTQINQFSSIQTIFSDFKFLLEVNTYNNLQSISSIYSGNTWIERELKEMNDCYFNNLVDSRKLLLNYNYEKNINYNNFNHIINDLNL